MMPIVIAILSVLWTLRIVGNVMSFVRLWWVKEYRWDRMIIHLKTVQGRGVYFLPWKLPHCSPKSVVLIGMSLMLLVVVVLSSGLPVLLALFIADILSFPLTFLLVGIVNLPVKLYHLSVIHRAEVRLRAQAHLTVIGITGSYGKTSTKDYLAAIVSSNYTTLKTEASKNAPIGIAEVVVSSLRDHEVFVVEMGAYKKGEVAYMSRLVRPEIAIVTAINAQHQDLFGSLENTMRAKYELVANLTGRRIAIMNADDSRVRTMGEWAKRDGATVWWYGKENSVPGGDHTFRATDIRADLYGVRFICFMGRTSVSVHANVVGAHQVSNILAAIAGAVAIGMTFKEAARAAGRIVSAKNVLELVSGVNGLTLIDDTFNNNPDAAKAALDVLAWGPEKRILVFQPMIELGAYTSSAHADVGAYVARICDAIILTNPNWAEDFIRGVRSVSREIPVSVLNGAKAAAYIRTIASDGGTVLGKGKEAKGVLALLRKPS